MKNIRVLLVGLTVVALAAGVVAGVLAARLPASGGVQHEAPNNSSEVQQSPRSPLEQELDLSPKQRDQMRRIWENVRDRVNACFREGQDLTRQRDNDIVQMLTDEQKAKFEKISKEYHDRWSKLGQAREAAFAQGVEETNKILNETQQKKYAEMISKRLGHVPTTEPIEGDGLMMSRPPLLPSPAEKK